MSTNQRIRTERFLGDVWECCRRFGASVLSGIRTPHRNKVKGGKEDSKHLEEGGWGLACDLWFDDASTREPAIAWLKGRGWHVYVGDDYDSRRLHVQGFQYGERPPRIEEVQA